MKRRRYGGTDAFNFEPPAGECPWGRDKQAVARKTPIQPIGCRLQEIKRSAVASQLRIRAYGTVSKPWRAQLYRYLTNSQSTYCPGPFRFKAVPFACA